MKFINYINFLSVFLVSGLGIAQSFEWGGRFGGIGEDVVRAMHVDHDGNSYTTGYFSDIADFDIDPEVEYLLTSNGFFDVFVQKNDSQGNLLWALNIGGEFFEYAVGITTDHLGNIYVTGVYEGIVDFDPGIGEFFLTSAGGLDIFILKLNKSGGFEWAKSIGGVGYEESTSIAIDSTGKVVVLGYFYDPADFDPGVGDHTLISNGSADVFILQLDENGDFIGANQFGGSDLDLGLDMKMGVQDDLFITGSFAGTADLDPRDLEEYWVTSSGQFSGFLIHLSNAGELLQVFYTDGGETISNSITADVHGNSYLSGYFSGIVDFNPTSGNSDFVFTADVSYNGYIMKIDPSGNVLWVRQMGGESPFFSFDLALDSNRNLFSTGYFDGTVDFDPSPTVEYFLTKESANAMDAFLLKLSNDGNFESAFQFGGADFIDTHRIGVDGADNIYLSAHFQLEIDINPEPGNSELIVAEDLRDNYLIKVSSGILGTPIFNKGNLAFYPNPAKSVVFILSNENIVGMDFSIFNIIGQQLKTGFLSSDKSIDIEDLKSGIYFIKIGTNNSIKLIKE